MVNRLNTKINSALVFMTISVRNSNWMQITEVLLVAKASQWFILTHQVGRCSIIRDPRLPSLSSAILNHMIQDGCWSPSYPIHIPRKGKEEKGGKGQKECSSLFPRSLIHRVANLVNENTITWDILIKNYTLFTWNSNLTGKLTSYLAMLPSQQQLFRSH